jgi:putative nucleotidyltransferase with HDIG domain
MATNAVIEQQRLLDAANGLEPLPVSVTRLASLIASDNYDARDVVEVISFDPALTASILRAANSASSAASKVVSTVHDAVVRLGGGPVLSIATGGAVRSRLKQIEDPTRAGMDAWRHAVTAALSSELVREVSPMYVPASAMTAALLHDIGKLVLAKALTPHMLHLIEQVAAAERLTPLEAEMAVLETHHGELGAVAAEAWELPEAITETIRFHHTPWLASSPLATVVYIADVVAHAAAAEDPDELPDSTTVRALEVMEIPPDSYGELIGAAIERYALLADRFAA